MALLIFQGAFSTSQLCSTLDYVAAAHNFTGCFIWFYATLILNRLAGGKKMKRKIMLVFVGFALVAVLGFTCGTANNNAMSLSLKGTANQNIEDVSMMKLIVNPEKYHGELVRIIGVSRIEFEGDGVWFTKEHFNHSILKNSLWIEPDYNALGATRQQLEQFNGKYVLMEGVFNKDNHGHLGMYSGALEKITRFQLWEKEEKTSQPTDLPSSSLTEVDGAISVQIDQPFTITIDQLAQLPEKELNLTFQEVLEDSRCPSNVECAESGQARILINVTQLDQTPTILELNTNPPLKQDVVTYENFQIHFLELNPYPEDIDQHIPEETYEALLVITDSQ